MTFKENVLNGIVYFLVIYVTIVFFFLIIGFSLSILRRVIRWWGTRKLIKHIKMGAQYSSNLSRTPFDDIERTDLIKQAEFTLNTTGEYTNTPLVDCLKERIELLKNGCTKEQLAEHQKFFDVAFEINEKVNEALLLNQVDADFLRFLDKKINESQQVKAKNAQSKIVEKARWINQAEFVLKAMGKCTDNYVSYYLKDKIRLLKNGATKKELAELETIYSAVYERMNDENL